jgi:hypothetical protein
MVYPVSCLLKVMAYIENGSQDAARRNNAVTPHQASSHF